MQLIPDESTGSLENKLTSGYVSLVDHSGTVGFLTHGLISRESYYEHCTALALIPFMWPQYYPEHQM